MKARPSSSQKRAPSARATNSGEPPTALKARAGLETPPGMTAFARANSCFGSHRLSAQARRAKSLAW